MDQKIHAQYGLLKLTGSALGAITLTRMVRSSQGVNRHAVFRTRSVGWLHGSSSLVDTLVQRFIICIEDTIMSDRRCQSKKSSIDYV